ncbi:voltage-dependent anion channel [Hypoxylon trugodes]|uniref:voltage-dependent anion channel n=1 Tax=Hypoxylon trugodes TaxID=326681 RepID=UPI00219D3C93|nr:voltage-dependent anion channel [Hypoxylon trugodes]KAI1389922.1 voltage-dependent anion channel [Hypoxylon trugodes]
MGQEQESSSSSNYEGSQENASPREGQKQNFMSDFLARLEHFTWANYTFPMSTGGLSLLLAEDTQGFIFPGLQTIGKIVYIFDLVIFTLVTAAIFYRFNKYPGTLKASVTHPTEALFLGTSTLSLASIISGIARYGIPSCGPWLVTAYRVLFWIYFVITFAIAVGQYSLLFTSPLLRIQDMTPAWDLPIFPFMLSGTVASAGAAFQPPSDALPMIVGGLTAQGLGMSVSIMMYVTIHPPLRASYVRRMIQWGFPSPNSRPGMFIAVGPPSFTSLAIIGLANDFPDHYNTFGADSITIQILRVLATSTSIFIWSMSLWFFCISVVANLAVRKQLTFHLNWYAYVFPNVGFTITIISIGKILQSRAVMAVGSAMTILLVLMWIYVFVHHVRAVINKEVLFEGKDEDVYVNEKNHAHVKPVKNGSDIEKEA